MTRIAIDTDATVRTLGELGVSEDGLRHAAGELLRPHLGILPPRLLAMLAFEQAQLASGLFAGSAVVHGERSGLALRLAGFLIADGGDIDAATADAVRSALAGPLDGIDPKQIMGVGWAGLGLLDGVGSFSNIFELSLFGMVRFAQRGLPGYEKMSLRYFHGEYESKILGKFGGKALGAAGIAISLKGNYEKSGAVTPVGKGISAALGAGIPTALDYRLFRGAPVFSTVDNFTGVFSGTQDATVVLGESAIRAMTGDGAGANAELAAWSQSALEGHRGVLVQGIAVVGDKTGGAIYDGAQRFQDAGEAFGGALYDAGHATSEAIHNIHRPSWLGG